MEWRLVFHNIINIISSENSYISGETFAGLQEK
jgi:hypothetical protein